MDLPGALSGVSVSYLRGGSCCNSKPTCKAPDLPEGGSEVCMEKGHHLLPRGEKGGEAGPRAGVTSWSPVSFTKGLRLSLECAMGGGWRVGENVFKFYFRNTVVTSQCEVS